MSDIIINEYQELLLKKNQIEQTLPYLPDGYISVKNIKGKQYYYLQNRVSEKIVSKYLKEDEAESIKKQVELAREYKAQLPKIEARLKELEQAAKLIDKSILRHLSLLKLSCGMDFLSDMQKERCIILADALNAIEGIEVSETTKHNIEKWKVKEETFISIFQATLNMYGFKEEV